MVALAAIRIRNLFAATMLMGIFSLLAAALYVLLDAVDVALTEAAVGAGISIILMLGALVLTTSKEKRHNFRHNLLALVVVLITGAALIYGTRDMPHFADPNAPAHQHVAPRYTQESVTEIGIPNMVASVLASYRGLDTLGETLVIFVAGVGVLLILGSGASTRREAKHATKGQARTAGAEPKMPDTASSPVATVAVSAAVASVAAVAAKAPIEAPIEAPVDSTVTSATNSINTAALANTPTVGEHTGPTPPAENRQG